MTEKLIVKLFTTEVILNLTSTLNALNSSSGSFFRVFEACQLEAWNWKGNKGLENQNTAEGLLSLICFHHAIEERSSSSVACQSDLLLCEGIFMVLCLEMLRASCTYDKMFSF